MDLLLATIDALTLVGLTTVSLQANRMWPLVVAALQLLVMFAHVSVLVSVGGKQVYWGMMAAAQYMQLLAIGLGITAHHFRERRTGRYRSWRHGAAGLAVSFLWPSLPHPPLRPAARH